MTISKLEADSGYMGNPARGASLGRSNRNPIDTLKSAESDIRTLKSAREYFDRIRDGRDSMPEHIETNKNLSRLISENSEKLQAAVDLKKRCLVSLNHWQKTQLFYLQRVQRDSGGYDSGGAYWGVGGTLWRYESQDKMTAGFLWEDTRAAAKESIIAEYKGAQFFK